MIPFVLAHGLAVDLALAAGFGRDLDPDLALILDRELVLDCDLDRDLGLGLGFDRVLVARARGIDPAPAVDLARALDRARILAGALDLPPALASDRDHLVVVLDRVVARVGEMIDLLNGRGTRSVLAAQVVARLVRLVPLGEQARYREEFDAELYDLAAAGASSMAQLTYARRLFARVWSLRRALQGLSAAGEQAR